MVIMSVSKHRRQEAENNTFLFDFIMFMEANRFLLYLDTVHIELVLTGFLFSLLDSEVEILIFINVRRQCKKESTLIFMWMDLC